MPLSYPRSTCLHSSTAASGLVAPTRLGPYRPVPSRCQRGDGPARLRSLRVGGRLLAHEVHEVADRDVHVNEVQPPRGPQRLAHHRPLVTGNIRGVDLQPVGPPELSHWAV